MTTSGMPVPALPNGGVHLMTYWAALPTVFGVTSTSSVNGAVVAVGPGVEVCVGLAVCVAVDEGVAVFVSIGVTVAVGAAVWVCVEVTVNVAVGAGVAV